MIRLEPFDDTCYDTLISWVNSPELLMQFAGPAFAFPLTREQLDESLSDPNRFSFRILDTGGQMIGVAEIYLTRQSCYLGRILIGNAQLRGKGLGELIVTKLLAYAFEVFQQEKVELNVFDWNAGAIRCYEKVGFRVDPEKKTVRMVNGKTWMAVNMTLNRSCWEQSQGL